MPHMIQLVIDCHDPHGLADWWADTLDWTVEPQDEAFIHSMIEQGHASLDETTRHEGRLVWRTGAAITSSESHHASCSSWFRNRKPERTDCTSTSALGPTRSPFANKSSSVAQRSSAVGDKAHTNGSR